MPSVMIRQNRSATAKSYSRRTEARYQSWDTPSNQESANPHYRQCRYGYRDAEQLSDVKCRDARGNLRHERRHETDVRPRHGPRVPLIPLPGGEAEQCRAPSRSKGGQAQKREQVKRVEATIDVVSSVRTR